MAAFSLLYQLIPEMDLFTVCCLLGILIITRSTSATSDRLTASFQSKIGIDCILKSLRNPKLSNYPEEQVQKYDEIRVLFTEYENYSNENETFYHSLEYKIVKSVSDKFKVNLSISAINLDSLQMNQLK